MSESVEKFYKTSFEPELMTGAGEPDLECSGEGRFCSFFYAFEVKAGREGRQEAGDSPEGLEHRLGDRVTSGFSKVSSPRCTRTGPGWPITFRQSSHGPGRDHSPGPRPPGEGFVIYQGTLFCPQIPGT